MGVKIIRLSWLAILLCLIGPRVVLTQGTNTGAVTGKVVREDGTPVVDAVVKCRQSQPKGQSGKPTRSVGGGTFDLRQTPLGWLTISAKKKIPGEATFLYGTTSAYAEQEKSKETEPQPIVLKEQQTTASISPPQRETAIVLAAFQLTEPLTPKSLPRNKQNQDAQTRDSVITGKISTGDNKKPGVIKIIVENDDTDEVILEKYLNLSTNQPNDFEVTLSEAGDYRLTILADDYYPANYLLIKQDPVVRQTGNTQSVAIPLLVIKSDGERLANSSAINVTLTPIEERRAEGLGRLINTEEAARRTAFQPRLMDTLPIPGLRSFDSFALLAPGVLPPPQTFNISGPGVSPGVGTPGQFSVNGLRSRENNFNIDGSDNNDEDIGVRRQGFVSLVSQSIETLQEFQIITALADARYGRNAGGQVNALSKTGSANFHGLLYGFFTDDRLNARDFFNQRASRQPASFTPVRASDNAPVLLDGRPLSLPNPIRGENPFTRIQAGFTLSGPIRQLYNTFFFASLERQILRGSKESHFIVPTVKERGIFNTGDTGLLETVQGLGPTPLFPASIPGNALFSLYPFPNNPLGPYGVNTYSAVLPADGYGTRFSIKLDRQFRGNGVPRKGPWWKSLLTYKSYGDQLTGRYNLTDERSTIPVTGGALFSALRPKVRTQNIAFFLNRILSDTTADTIRFSFGRTRLFFGERRDPALLPSSLFPETPFLLNAPLLLNVTAPNANGFLNAPRYISAASQQGTALLASLGYPLITQTEQLTGPLGQVTMPGFSPIGVDVENFPQTRANNTFQIADTITQVKGKNIFTFGVDIRKVQINSILDRNFSPSVEFNGLTPNPASLNLPVMQPNGAPLPTNLLTSNTLAAAGVPTGIFQSLAVVPDSSIGLRFTQVNLFFQDERRLRHNFHLTLGLRYEVNTVPDTVGGRLERAFDPQLLRTQAEQAVNFCNNPRCNDLVSSLTAAFPANFKVSFGADRNDFDFRLGFAWVPEKYNRTALRGGFGLYSGQYPGIVIDQSRNAFSAFLPLNLANFSPRSGNTTFLFNLANPNVRQLAQSLHVIAPGTLNTFPSVNPIALLANQLFGLGNLSLSPTILGLDLVLPQSRLKTPYSLQYGFTLEQQFKHDYLVSIAYVGTQGVKLLRVTTPDQGLNNSRLNFVRANPLTANAPFPFFQGQELPPQSNIISSSFAITRTFFESTSHSSYNSLQAEFRKRYGDHVQFGSSFTYSHSIDDASDFFDTAGAFALPQNSLQISERASSNFDVRLRSATYFIIDIPQTNLFGKGSKILAGWQVAGIITAQTGQPYTVNSAIDVNHDGNLTDRLNTTDGLIFGPIAGDRRIQLRLAPGVNPSALLAPDGFNGAVGRNTFRAPGLFTVDVSLGKNFALSERSKFILRTEIFNLFNRANFGIPVRILESPAFGTSVNTTVPARTLQFVLKYEF